MLLAWPLTTAVWSCRAGVCGPLVCGDEVGPLPRAGWRRAKGMVSYSHLLSSAGSGMIP